MPFVSAETIGMPGGGDTAFSDAEFDMNADPMGSVTVVFALPLLESVTSNFTPPSELNNEPAEGVLEIIDESGCHGFSPSTMGVSVVDGRGLGCGIGAAHGDQSGSMGAVVVVLAVE